MPIKVYLSEANQAGNPTADGSNEKALMVPIVRATAALLAKDPRFEVMHCTFDGVNTAVANVTQANLWGADRYVAIHSNASGVVGHPVKGTIAFYYSTSAKGKQLAQALYDEVAPLSPGTNDYGIQPHDGFIEIGRPNAPAVLIELEGHDWVTGCEFLHKYNVIARALYKGICHGVGLIPSIDVLDPEQTRDVTVRRSQWAKVKEFIASLGGTVVPA